MMSCKAVGQDEQECYAVAIPVDYAPPAKATNYAAVVADDQLPKSQQDQPTHQPPQAANRKPPSWIIAFIVMFGYHVFAFVLSLVAITTVFTMFCLAAILLPFCGIGLVVFRFLVMLVDALLVLEVWYNNWAFELLGLSHLVLHKPKLDTRLFGESDECGNNLHKIFNCNNWTKILYFGVFKWVILLFHLFAAICTPVTTLTSLLLGFHGICPVASVGATLTRSMVKRM